jgi:hypothetical protein
MAKGGMTLWERVSGGYKAEGVGGIRSGVSKDLFIFFFYFFGQ